MLRGDPRIRGSPPFGTAPHRDLVSHRAIVQELEPDLWLAIECTKHPLRETGVKALTWHGKSDMRCESVPDPKIEHPRDAIIKVTACAICGSDLHIFDGVIPAHEAAATSSAMRPWAKWSRSARRTRTLKVGDRVVVPFTIACGECFFCQRGFFSGCERTNPDHAKAAKLWGHSPAGLFGYSHLLGRLPRRPGRISARALCRRRARSRCPTGSATSRSCSCPTSSRPATWRAEFCNIQRGETIAIWGCGPVGQFAIRSAFLLGADRVIAIDTVPERLAARARRRRRDDRFHEGGCLRPHPGADARPRRRCLHRRGRHRARDDGERSIPLSTASRSRPSWAPTGRTSAPGDPLLPQLRHRLDRRRLWRLPRQDSDGLGDQPRA